MSMGDSRCPSVSLSGYALKLISKNREEYLSYMQQPQKTCTLYVNSHDVNYGRWASEGCPVLLAFLSPVPDLQHILYFLKMFLVPHST